MQKLFQKNIYFLTDINGEKNNKCKTRNIYFFDRY